MVVETPTQPVTRDGLGGGDALREMRPRTGPHFGPPSRSTGHQRPVERLRKGDTKAVTLPRAARPGKGGQETPRMSPVPRSTRAEQGTTCPVRPA